MGWKRRGSKWEEITYERKWELLPSIRSELSLETAPQGHLPVQWLVEEVESNGDCWLSYLEREQGESDREREFVEKDEAADPLGMDEAAELEEERTWDEELMEFFGSEQWEKQRAAERERWMGELWLTTAEGRVWCAFVVVSSLAQRLVTCNI